VLQLGSGVAGEDLHLFGDIQCRAFFTALQARVVGIANQANRGARHAETNRLFGTDLNEIEMPT